MVGGSRVSSFWPNINEKHSLIKPLWGYFPLKSTWTPSVCHCYTIIFLKTMLKMAILVILLLYTDVNLITTKLKHVITIEVIRIYMLLLLFQCICLTVRIWKQNTWSIFGTSYLPFNIYFPNWSDILCLSCTSSSFVFFYKSKKQQQNLYHHCVNNCVTRLL